jgi:hypothetical protein
MFKVTPFLANALRVGTTLPLAWIAGRFDAWRSGVFGMAVGPSKQSTEA